MKQFNETDNQKLAVAITLHKIIHHNISYDWAFYVAVYGNLKRNYQRTVLCITGLLESFLYDYYVAKTKEEASAMVDYINLVCPAPTSLFDILLSFKEYLSKTPGAEIESYSDQEFVSLYLTQKQNAKHG